MKLDDMCRLHLLIHTGTTLPRLNVCDGDVRAPAMPPVLLYYWLLLVKLSSL